MRSRRASRRARPGWCRLSDPKDGKTSQVWEYRDGLARLQHCGHPTALYPWSGRFADGTPILVNGRGAFRFLVEAMETAELELERREAEWLETRVRELGRVVVGSRTSCQATEGVVPTGGSRRTRRARGDEPACTGAGEGAANQPSSL